MKKLLVALFMLMALCVPAMAGSWDTYFYAPWQVMSTATSGATSALITLEATANTNIVIDRIVVNSDLSTATLTIGSIARNAAGTAFRSDVTTEATVTFAAAPVCQNIGGSDLDGEPIFIGDVGRAIQLRLTGTTNECLFVSAKRGQMPLSKVARNQAKGF